jgi:hypothetical protein
MPPGDAFFPDRLGQVVAYEGAHLGAERQFVRGQLKIHVASRDCSGAKARAVAN